MNSKVYRWCAVPQCKNTSIKTPNKLFVFVPQKKMIRDNWLRLARRDTTAILPSTHLYFCEDHFDMPNDMENYMEYHLMGSVSQIRMKPGCMPTKYHCQTDRKKRTSDAPERSYILKKQRRTLIEECEKDLEGRTIATKQVELRETSCGSSVYRWCAVPQCKNTSIKTPNKLFVFVPQKKTIRDNWLRLARRDTTTILPSTHLYFCEDHFDMPNDMENYMEYHLMGSVSKIRMKPGCLPTKYHCQTVIKERTSDSPEQYILKKQRKTFIEECEKDLEGTTIATKLEPGETSSGSSDEFICEPDVKVFLKEEEMDTMEYKPVTRKAEKRRPSEETLKAKKEMLQKMKKMRAKLEEMQEAEAADSSAPVAPAGKWKSANTKAFHNIITLVENSYVCPFGSTFSNYLCIYCRDMFTDPDKLREHTLSHDPKIYQDTVAYKRDLQIDIARIDCRLCPQKIDNLDAFYKHITSDHDKQLYPNIKNEFLKFVLRAGNLSCLVCGTNYTNYHALKRHMAEHFGTCICDICGVHFFEENKLVVHQKCHRDKTNNRFPCKECGKLFKSKHGMYYHVSRAHSAEPTFHCYKCDEMLFSQTLRYRHMIEVHGETARKFPCDNCNKVYDTRKSLREHNRKAHLRNYRHECKVCQRKFYLPSALKDHMASHSGERNFRCEYCGKSYPRLRALKVHMQSHETEKKYKCNMCPASYTQSNNLKNHMKTKHDSDYVDDMCE